MARTRSLPALALLTLLGCGESGETRRPAPPGGGPSTADVDVPSDTAGVVRDDGPTATDPGKSDAPLPEGMGIPC